MGLEIAIPVEISLCEVTQYPMDVSFTSIGNKHINLAKIFNNLFHGLGNLCGIGDWQGVSEYKWHSV